jgi:hypothetical protein
LKGQKKPLGHTMHLM